MTRVAECALGGLAVLFLGVWASAEPRLGRAQAPAKPEGAIRLATYNVLNLFDDRDDPSLNGRYDDWFDREKGVRAKPESQQASVAEAIRRLDADVIGLEEIESFDALIEFRERYLKGLGYDHVASIDVGQERGIEQAVLSRYPIREATVWPTQTLGGAHPAMVGSRENELAGKPIESRRSPLRVVVEVPAADAGGKPYELTVFVVHHKAGYGYGYWRESEARALLATIKAMEERDPQVNIAVLGDFNATPQDSPARMYCEAGMIDTLAGRGVDDARYITHESDRTLDFILVNSGLAQDIVPDSAFVLGTPVRAKGADWRTTPEPEDFASDHQPVAVDLRPGE